MTSRAKRSGRITDSERPLAARAAVAAAVAPSASGRLTVFGDLELAAVAVAEQLEPLVGLGGQLRRLEQARVLAPASTQEISWRAEA